MNRPLASAIIASQTSSCRNATRRGRGWRFHGSNPFASPSISVVCAPASAAGTTEQSLPMSKPSKMSAVPVVCSVPCVSMSCASSAMVTYW
eukprot:scaffold16214_cov73-Phaeocystis_antarctica.AAC.6